MENFEESLTEEEKEHARIETEAYNAVRNGIDWGKEEGEGCVSLKARINFPVC